MGIISRIIFIILAVATAVVLIVKVRKQSREAAEGASFDTAGPESVARLREQGAAIIDIRPPRAFARDGDRVEGSVNVAASELKTKLAEMANVKVCLVVSDNRERMIWAAKLISSSGVSRVFILDGGIDAYHDFISEEVERGRNDQK